MYAPIIIFCYNRADHLAQTYEALKACPEAKDSDLFVFSDGAKNDSAEKGVKEVRAFLQNIKLDSAFKTTTITEAPENKGLAKSIIDGVTEVIKKYGRAIVLEDDCVPSPYLLGFMNKCLDELKYDMRVGSIAGFTPDFGIPKSYNADVFTTFRSCSWGWATWADRWERVDWELSDRSILKSREFIKKFNSVGSDRFIRLYRQVNGDGSSWSVRFGAHLVKNNMLTVYPKYSYISNIGCDESGVHSKKDDAEKMRVDLSKAIADPKIEFVAPDQLVLKLMKKHYSGGLVSDIKRAVATSVIMLKEKFR